MNGKLSAYRAKRNFSITSEPDGKFSLPGNQLRFVVQKHAARTLHYDFRLELDGTLKSWAVPKGPSLDPAQKRLAVHVEDHPLDYIDFQGEIPAHQYGAGNVEIWDRGTWRPLGDPLEGFRAGKLKFHLDGEKLHGDWNLVRTRLHGGDKREHKQEQWLLIKERDEYAQSGERQSQTIAASADPVNPAVLKNAVQADLPPMLHPQLAVLLDSVPQAGDWLYEIKFDGYRLMVRVAADGVRLYTRDGKDWTDRLPDLADAIHALGLSSAWLDGEIVALDREGIPSFQLLQNAFSGGGKEGNKEGGKTRILFYLFDLPYLNGVDLRGAPLVERRQLLARILGKITVGPLRLSTVLDESPADLLQNACLMSMEGIVGKRRDSAYAGTRNGDWIKLKCRKRQEFVIAGYTEPHGARKYFGALLLAVYDDSGDLHYVGRVGTGFDRSILQSTYQQLVALEQVDCPFREPPSGALFTPTHWVAPQLVAEISFSEWTHDGLLRQAVFHGLRLDKRARDIRREDPVHARAESSGAALDAALSLVDGEMEPVLHNVSISHPDRVIDPSNGLNKLDLVRYYDYVAPAMLPFLKNRPVYLLRAPAGIDGELFFQRHVTRTPIPGIDTLDQSLDTQNEAVNKPLMAINSAHALIAAMQMGTVELHVCNATADRLDQPDCMIFDLDPDPDLSWPSVVLAAQLIKVVLDELNLKSFVKTSGGKGLHVMVPLAQQDTWEDVSEFSRAVSLHMARTIPAHFSAKMGARNRIGKVFVDYLRNQRHASTVAPYSVRARAGLPVATPIAWDELKTTTGAAMWTVRSLPKRLLQIQHGQHDPWRDCFTTKQVLTEAMWQKFEHLLIRENRMRKDLERK